MAGGVGSWWLVGVVVMVVFLLCDTYYLVIPIL